MVLLEVKEEIISWQLKWKYYQSSCLSQNHLEERGLGLLCPVLLDRWLDFQEATIQFLFPLSHASTLCTQWTIPRLLTRLGSVSRVCSGYWLITQVESEIVWCEYSLSSFMLKFQIWFSIRWNGGYWLSLKWCLAFPPCDAPAASKAGVWPK